ncbi:MAG: Asp-tRNA(Asn)/Glu-tRNA(Gln) amidotransferase subunit GatB [Actinomycetota bacterium]
MTDREAVIGLECHVELSTRTKMFCGCSNAFGAAPNANTCPVCLGHPGTLPVPNEQAIVSITTIGLALDSEIAPRSEFARKNYFYPDMPKNFQISQYDLPTCVGGHLDIDVDGDTRRIGITRVHMEEDTGKTTHAGTTGRISEAEYALIDYNRAGVPLVECVSEPDMRTAGEAGAYLRTLRSTLESLGVSDVRMEEGSLRCDANVSVRERGVDAFGTKVEIKNMNSVRSLERAIRFEIDRQNTLLDAGQSIVQETRHWNEDEGTTHSMRSKEEAFDYRYFPEPDIPPLRPDRAWIEQVRTSLPELPAARRARYERELALNEEPARLLASSRELGAFFEEAVQLGAAPIAAANWLTQDLAGTLNKAGVTLADAKITPQHIADVVQLVDEGTVSSAGAKQIVEAAVATGDRAQDIVVRMGLTQVSDEGALGGVIDEVITENAEAADRFRGGNEGTLGFLVGQVMKKTGGSANPKLAGDLLRSRLSS